MRSAPSRRQPRTLVPGSIKYTGKRRATASGNRAVLTATYVAVAARACAGLFPWPGRIGNVQPDGTWFINNTGFLAGRTGVTSVDACFTECRTRDYLAAIAAATAQPVRTLVNTHHHGDHTHGNYLLRGATIVAHEKCRAEILAAGLPNFGGLFGDVDWGAIEHLQRRQAAELPRLAALKS